MLDKTDKIISLGGNDTNQKKKLLPLTSDVIFKAVFSRPGNEDILKSLLEAILDIDIKEVQVQNQVGLHARPATFFIQKANEYKSTVWVEKEERRVNAKSLLGVLSLGILGGTEVTIIADGVDEEAAVEALVKLVESGFTD